MPIWNSLGKKEAIMNPEGTKTAKNLKIFPFPLASLKSLYPYQIGLTLIIWLLGLENYLQTV